MENLKKAIIQYNETNEEYFGDDDGFNVLTQADPSNEAEISTLQEISNI
jgi:hypothetical protein